MARVLVAPQTPPGSYPALQPGAGTLAVTFQAADATNFNYTPLTSGKTFLLAMNPDSSARTVTITSIEDGQNRTGDITAYSIPAVTGTTPVVAMFGPFQTLGWSNSGQLWFQASNAAVLFAVLTVSA